MLEGLLRFLSVSFSLVVLLSLAPFAIDEARSGSQSSQAGIASRDFTATADPSGYARPTPAQERAREAQHGTLRELVDDGNDVLVAPFASITEYNSSAGMRRMIPAALALFVYGFGLGFLARYAAGRA